MAQNKKHITPENITEWLSSTGFLFPRNEVELERFEKLYGELDLGLTGKEIDPDKIIDGTYEEKKISKIPDDINQEEIEPYRMAARKGNALPKHILDKIKKNQNKQQMILPIRKKQICKLAEFIASDFSDKNITLLNKIAKSEDVPVHYDNYEDAFDGILLFDTDNNNFHIHINVDNGNTETSKRGRFTLAHELAHFFLDEHRLGLKYGLLEPHASFHNLNHKVPIEEEADYFAGCLLMPKEKFRNYSAGYKKQTRNKKFSFDTIYVLSESFQASVLATLIRFGEVGTHEIFAVISKDSIAKWFVKSADFPNWKFKFKIGDAVPKTTVAGEYFAMKDRKFTTVEQVSADDWFVPSKDDNRANRQMFEQCYYSDSYGYVISLIWFE